MRMDLQYLIDKLETLVRSGRRMPITNKLMMDEQELVTLVDDMRSVMPDEIRYAKQVLREKEQILADAQLQADDILSTARRQAEGLIEREGLLRQAKAQADEIRQKAEAEAERVQVGADNYVRQVLTDLSESLQRQIASINKGLDSLK